VAGRARAAIGADASTVVTIPTGEHPSMSDSALPPAAYDTHTTDHGVIRDWVRDRGGQPVAVSGDDGAIDVTFDDGDGSEGTPIEWETFFERFDEQDLVFAVRESPDEGDPNDAYAIFDRTRIEASNRLGDSDREGSADPIDEEARRSDSVEDPDHVGDGRSETRHSEAADQENVDGHRDEPPYNS